LRSYLRDKKFLQQNQNEIFINKISNTQNKSQNGKRINEKIKKVKRHDRRKAKIL
jgi:hypothetical protein